MTQTCPICQSNRTKFLSENYDIWYGYPDSFELDRCGDCGHIFIVGDVTEEMLSDFYTNYYPRKLFNLDLYKPYVESTGFFAWLDGDRALCHRWVPKNVRVLDIGCGYCETLGYHKKRGCEVYGVEADENTAKIAERYGFNVHVGFFDANNYEKDFFDYVTMNWVLEHCLNPEETLRQVYSVLKPEGKLIFSIPNSFSISRYTFGQLWTRWHTPYHLHLFSQHSARLLIEKTGFRYDGSKSFTPSSALVGQWAFLFVHGKKCQKSKWARPCPELYFEKNQEKIWFIRLYRFLEKIRIHAWLMRFGDAIGMGDDRLYFATKK
ncbi:MAG: class I SAM-dependent methyltransferase [Planctomycetaceae bacterium]|jgi:SAM-dependent methyltransferase|nr:class I SAM-dependent methyltransferase [Planctomycetaceae bacterium]